jgi:subtilisin family serine protease
MNPLDAVKLRPLMERSRGSARIVVALIDGPVAMGHAYFAAGNIREVPGIRGTCAKADSVACRHGTFVAGILCAARSSPAPAICPACTVLVRPIFPESASANGSMPSATPEELAAAILECIDAGSHVLNLSLGLAPGASKAERELDEALNHAARRGVLVVAAAGNQGTLGSTAVTRHPWVIPVAACDGSGHPASDSNMGSSIGRRGLMAPGDGITSLGTAGKPITLGGTSAATPFVTGAAALLWSLFSNAPAADIKLAITQGSPARRKSVAPPMLNAWGAYQVLSG